MDELATPRHAVEVSYQSIHEVTCRRINILLADDSRSERDEIRKLLQSHPDFVVIGEAPNGKLAVKMAIQLRPAVVLMDISMPLLNGLLATSQILEVLPDTKVVILSAYNDEAYIHAAIKAGAMGYLLKQTCVEDLCCALHDVQNGQPVFSPSIPKRLQSLFQQRLLV